MSLEESPSLKVFFDTNVLVAAFITKGLCYELLERASYGEFTGITSIYVINELKEVLERNFPDQNLKDSRWETEELIKEALEIINPDPEFTIKGVCRDSTYDEILCGAFASKADYLVTGDSDLLELKEFKNFRILTPREFIIELIK